MSSRKKIRTAVIGVGYLGKLHAEKYALVEDAELVGVTDTNAQRAAEIAALVKTTAYGDYRELFGKVDAVSVVTPTVSHRRIGLDFLSRGVDVLMEKPIANSVTEARDLVSEAERTGRILQVGHLERFNGAMFSLGDKVNDPVYIEALRISPFPNRSTDVDVILDVMIHDIDLVLTLAGSEVESVEAAGMPVVSDKVDVANARLRFKNGCVASITSNRAAKEKVRRITLYQQDACITIDYGNQALFVSRPTLDPATGLKPLVDEPVIAQKKDALLEEIRSFVDSCITRRPPLVSGRDGMRALEVAGMVQQAIKANRAGEVR